MPHLLLVCTGNICRSPFAEALVRATVWARGLDLQVGSAGTTAPAGDPPDRKLLKVAAKYGLDLSGHRARQATPELLGSADLVLGMTARHVSEILRRAPQAPATTLVAASRRAAALAGTPMDFATWARKLTVSIDGRDSISAHEEISDPYGGPTRAYRRMTEEVETAVRNLMDVWLGHRRGPSRGA